MNAALALSPPPEPQVEILDVPCAKNVEKALLSVLLNEPQTWVDRFREDGITGEHFHAHKALWNIIERRVREGASLDRVSLVPDEQARGTLAAVGDASGFVEVANFAPNDHHYPAHLKILRETLARRRAYLAGVALRGITNVTEPEEVAAMVSRLHEAVGAALADSKDGIRDILAARSFDFETIPPPPFPILKLGDKTVTTPGNITNIQGAAKTGKSATLAAIIASVLNGNRVGADTLGFSAENPEGKALLHFDTEQSRYDHDALVRRSLRRAGITEPPPWFESYSLADCTIEQRLSAIRFAMKDANRRHGGIFAAIIDGVADVCRDPNDPEESFALVDELHRTAADYKCGIITVLHENPGSENGKTRGHLGSQLERKAETPLRLAKDAASGITTIWCDRARSCHIPKDQGLCFEWSDAMGMHVSCGTAGEIKASEKSAKFRREAESAFEGDCTITYTDLVQRIHEVTGLCERSAKGRVKTYMAEGIVGKSQAGNYSLKPC